MFSVKTFIGIFLSVFLISGCGSEKNKPEFKPNSPEAKGYDIFTRMACNACHSTDGSLKLGPTIKGQFGKEIRHTDGSIRMIDEEYIRESINEPLKFIAEGFTPIMPSYKPILKEQDIAHVIAYIKALQ
ncbi:MAG: cytochrome c [Candidatus Marinimicrobia bacterium]|jgi:cytochrome c oxidase subunit 2|nr:cytochrome c [Candidatus Neomarinimicrobiota bacterium]MDP6852838.1 cytochrome c [Candidatus Neomarinimicrobiota bacterium]MDP6936090.1 cytochrome c [Candidatus Neomarinimicrobiota bacterium]